MQSQEIAKLSQSTEQVSYSEKSTRHAVAGDRKAETVNGAGELQ